MKTIYVCYMTSAELYGFPLLFPLIFTASIFVSTLVLGDRSYSVNKEYLVVLYLSAEE